MTQASHKNDRYFERGKMMNIKISNVRLLVVKFDETFLFYRDVLGFKVTWGNVGTNAR